MSCNYVQPIIYCNNGQASQHSALNTQCMDIIYIEREQVANAGVMEHSWPLREGTTNIKNTEKNQRRRRTAQLHQVQKGGQFDFKLWFEFKPKQKV